MGNQDKNPDQNSRKSRSSRPEPVHSGLRPWLAAVFGLFALLGINSFYLLAVTVAEKVLKSQFQDSFYQWMFLVHLVLGVLIILPFVVFGFWHLKRSWSHPNRRAVKAGMGLFIASLLLLISGVLLTRIEGILEIRSPAWRTIFYATHVATPMVTIWLFVLHRLAGVPIRWAVSYRWSFAGLLFVLLMLVWHQYSVPPGMTPAAGDQYFEPSLARTSDGKFIEAHRLMRDDSCRECHPDVHSRWSESAHRFSSFNNPAYLASVKNTRDFLMERDGDVHASRFCAGCHDPVPFFSGAFDDPDFDMDNHPTAHAAITCTVCHAIESVPGPRGNGEYVIGQPELYPFAMSEDPLLKWVNRQLIKAKPAFHKKTYLKPLHEQAEFCGSCHKVHIPEELNHYKWLRGQNHYDSWLLSGVSGHGVASFYYPAQAENDCNGCHMPAMPSTDFGAKDITGTGILSVHDHLFPGANTAMRAMVGTSESSLEVHRKFLEGSIDVDIFGIRRGDDVDAPLEAPIHPRVPAIEPGETILVQTVLRTMGMGHHFTEGTADSNQTWVSMEVFLDGEPIASSGLLDEKGVLDPWSHMMNALVLDREGNRIHERNVEDIFIALYNHQIPPGAADSLHYRLDVPNAPGSKLTVRAKALYRKFDTHFLSLFMDGERNDLPVVTLGEDEVTFVIGGPEVEIDIEESKPTWMRWNDYGIGMLRKGAKGAVRGELVTAISAFEEVTRLGRPDGAMNKARALIKAGRLDEAALSLDKAAQHDPPPPPWSLDWFGSLVNRENGYYDAALTTLLRLYETRYPGAAERGFDFSRDVRLLNELGTVCFAIARQREEGKSENLQIALNWFDKVLVEDPENTSAHWNLAQIHDLLALDQNQGADSPSDSVDHAAKANFHRSEHSRYKVDDNARDVAVSAHRSNNPPANASAEAIVIYPLQPIESGEEEGKK